MKSFILYIVIFFNAILAFGQTRAFDKGRIDSLAQEKISLMKKDTLIKDTSKKILNPSGLDSTVHFYAKDKITFEMSEKALHLYGNSYIEYKTQKLSAETINIAMDSSYVEAYGKKDSNGKLIGFPKFKDGAEEYVGERIGFNMKTKRGVINLGETTMEGGFYNGAKIKRISDDEYFIQDGHYTTCDAPQPHFYFGSPKMKAIMKDRVLLDPIVLYVEDLPVFMVPFGLFFPTKSGRQSGLIVPSFFFSQNRGVVFEGLGYYYAESDYWDTKLTTNIYSKGGYLFNNETRYSLKNVLGGSVNLQYGNTRYSPDDNYTKNWSFSLRHNETINPTTKLDANAQFTSQGFYKNTSTSLSERQTQNISSNIGLSKSFQNGSSLSLSFARTQNIINNEVSQTFPSISYSLPQFYPLKNLVSSDNWLSQTSFSYSTNGTYNYYRKLGTDSALESSHSASIRHNPSLSVSPKLGFFTIKPNISFSAATYFRKTEKSFDTNTNQVVENSRNGMFWEYYYSVGIGVSTTLYGMAKPNFWGIKAIRHTFQPSVNYSYSPSFGGSNYDFYGKYKDSAGNVINYSKYSKDGGGISPRTESQTLSYSILNSVEAKIKTNDSIGEKNLDLLRFNISGSYNFRADSLKASDIAVSLRTPALTFLSLNSSATFTLYDEAISKIVNGATTTKNATRINQYLISNGKGLARLSYFTLQASTSFGSNGASIGSSFGKDEKKKDTTKTEKQLGERFAERMNYQEEDYSLFGDDNPGAGNIAFPWTVSVSVSYSYSAPTTISITRQFNANANFSFNLTPSWKIEGAANYDFVNKESISPSFTVTKDLHCWSLLFNWYPTGYNKGFYLKFNIKAPQLQDLKIEKHGSPSYY